MKLSKLKAMIESASDDAEIKIENGEIVITNPQPIEYKFKVDDRVLLIAANQVCTVEKVIDFLSGPAYKVSGWDGIFNECAFAPAPQDITERIQCLEDARQWCNRNGKSELVCDLDYVSDCFDGLNDENKRDILAYLKLRIISAALNEGWEQRFDGVEEQYFPFYGNDEIRTEVQWKFNSIYSKRMAFKTNKLALYAAAQFRDIYADFCGCKKGGEQ